MGGHALKTLTTHRLTDRNYHRLCVDVVEKLTPLFSKVAVIPAYSGKADFGDMDVLVIGNRDEAALHAAFGYRELVKNGPVWSLDYQNFQIDLIKTNEVEFDYSFNFYAHNDLGNLIGRIAHSLGFKHGHAGLIYVIRDGDRVIDEIVVTRDYDKALTFLGFSTERYHQGFDSLGEIFEFVADSKYFNPDIYLLHNRNAVARARDSKRPTYNQFLEWCAVTSPETRYVADRSDKSHYLEWAFVAFPDFRKRYGIAMAAFARKKALSAKLNGRIVGEVTGFVDRELGMVLVKLCAAKNDDWLLAANEDEIRVWITTTLKESNVKFYTSP